MRRARVPSPRRHDPYPRRRLADSCRPRGGLRPMGTGRVDRLLDRLCDRRLGGVLGLHPDA